MVHENNKQAIISMVIILALPIPISILTWIPTLMSLAGDGSFLDFFTSVGAFLFLLMMISSGTYLFTYIFAVIKTCKDGKISWISYLPAWQVVLSIALMFLALFFQSS